MSTRAWSRGAPLPARGAPPALYCPPQRNVLAKVPHRLRKRVAREVAAVFRAPGLAVEEAPGRSRRAGTRSSPRQSTCLSGASRPPPSSTRSPSPTGPDCAPRTASPAHRDPSDPERRRLPRPSQPLRLITAVALRTTAVWSERRSISRFSNRRRLTEASRSFLSLLHTTRDLTAPPPLGA